MKMEKKTHGILTITLVCCVLAISFAGNIMLLNVVNNLSKDKHGPENGRRIASGTEPQNRMPDNIAFFSEIDVFWDGQSLYFRPLDSLEQEKFLSSVEELSASGFLNIQNLSPGLGSQNKLVEVDMGNGRQHLRFLCIKK
jgi:hypothetical protein